MQHIKSILAKFEPITLMEMDGVLLMDRTDTKFIFLEQELPFILEQMKEDYRVLEVKNHRISRYESLYFDTPDFQLYHNHHRGKTNRFKIRFRKYVESDLHFFEVKLKNNKGRTIKDRVLQEGIESNLHSSAALLLAEKTALPPEGLEPKFWVNYSRMTFVNKRTTERVTIDINLTFKNEENNKTINNLVIAEVKQDRVAASAFLNVMKQLRIRNSSISKYCYGVIMLVKKIKYNNFKPNLIQINKLLHGTLAGTH